MATHENLLATVEALKSAREMDWKPKPYKNKHDVWGVSFCFWSARHYHCISVHNCNEYPSFLELKYAVEGIEALDDEQWGIYANSKYVPGFYATARSTRTFDYIRDRWYMISRSDQRNFIMLLNRKCAESEYDHELKNYLGGRNEAMTRPTSFGYLPTPVSPQRVPQPNLTSDL